MKPTVNLALIDPASFSHRVYLSILAEQPEQVVYREVARGFKAEDLVGQYVAFHGDRADVLAYPVPAESEIDLNIGTAESVQYELSCATFAGEVVALGCFSAEEDMVRAIEIIAAPVLALLAIDETRKEPTSQSLEPHC
jgi:hypothetical protein